MKKRTLIAFGLILVAALLVGFAFRNDFISQEAKTGQTKASTMQAKGSYATVNGLKMYYEIHGEGEPLVLLHGALSTIEVDFGQVLPTFAETRQVIAIEQQAHGHTADIDRPLSYEQMADDTAALLQQLNIENADFFGYSMGGGIALQIAIRHPDLVRKLVVAAATYNSGGYHPRILAGEQTMKPEDLAGSPFQEAYARTAPNPEAWPALIAKVQQLDGQIQDWLPQDIQAIAAPTLLIYGDADVVRPEHAVELFRLRGGGVAGDIAGRPNSHMNGYRAVSSCFIRHMAASATLTSAELK